MITSLSWLKNHLNTKANLNQVAERLTEIGLEVENIKSSSNNLDNFIICKIVKSEKHPNADRLNLVTVDINNEVKKVVCGAPNVEINQKIAFAKVGSELLDHESQQLVPLQAAKIRGVVSEGMICSEKELGIGDNHDGILVLPPKVPKGTKFVITGGVPMGVPGTTNYVSIHTF